MTVGDSLGWNTGLRMRMALSWFQPLAQLIQPIIFSLIAPTTKHDQTQPVPNIFVHIETSKSCQTTGDQPLARIFTLRFQPRADWPQNGVATHTKVRLIECGVQGKHTD